MNLAGRLLGCAVLVATMLACAAIAHGQQQQPHRAYLPVIMTQRVLVEDTRPGKPEICMAWVPGALVERSMTDFDAAMFFHSGSHQPGAIAQGGIPVWRSPNVPNNFLSVPSSLRFNGYNGIVKLFNEPDLTGQDGPLSPQDAAALYRAAKILLPGAAFVTPNAIGMDYLIEFMAAVGDDWRQGWDIVGIHGYETYQLDMWPGEWLEPVIALAESYRSYLWVSEVGVDGNRSIAWQRRFTEEFANNAAVQTVCWHTPHCGGYPTGCELNLYQDDWLTLTLTGEILQRVLDGGEWPTGSVYYYD